MTRVELFNSESAPLTTRAYFADGDPGPIVAALASVPELLAPTLGLVGSALSPGAIGVRAKEFAILRTSVLQGCTYCIHAHTAAGLDVGLSPGEVRALRGEVALELGFPSEAERALIGWIDALAGATGKVPDDVWSRARAHWPEHALIEICITVGATMLLNRLATGLQLPTSDATRQRLAAENFE